MEEHGNQQSNQNEDVWNDAVEHFVLQLKDRDMSEWATVACQIL